MWVDGLTLISRQYNGLDEDEVKDKVEDEDMPMVDSDRNCYDLLLSNIKVIHDNHECSGTAATRNNVDEDEAKVDPAAPRGCKIGSIITEYYY